MKSWICASTLVVAVPLALAVSHVARSQSLDGYLNDDTPLYAGPAPEYPQIEGLPYGTYVSVQGCTEGWEWCDVVADQGDWGWVPGDYIDYVYNGQPVVVTDYGPRIGIPIVSFSISNYWDEHYRDRPFYRERTTWFQRDIPHRAPPPHHVSHRGPPPPPPGGWHHARISAHASGAPSHRENAQSQHQENVQMQHHESAPNPPRAPVNEPEYPRGDHHANIATPPSGAPTQHETAHAPPHSRAVPHKKYPASNTSHGQRPPDHQRKKDDHDNGQDNGH